MILAVSAWAFIVVVQFSPELAEVRAQHVLYDREAWERFKHIDGFGAEVARDSYQDNE